MPSLSPCSLLFLFPCFLFCFHFVCSFFLRFDLFSLFCVVFCSFFLRFVACFLVYPCFVPFCSFLFFFPSFCCFFPPLSVRSFFLPFVFFSLLWFLFLLCPSFFFSLALLLPPLLFGLFFPPEIAVNMAQVPAKTGWAMWNRLRGTGDWPVLNECMHRGAWFRSTDLWVMGSARYPLRHSAFRKNFEESLPSACSGLMGIRKTPLGSSSRLCPHSSVGAWSVSSQSRDSELAQQQHPPWGSSPRP